MDLKVSGINPQKQPIPANLLQHKIFERTQQVKRVNDAYFDETKTNSNSLGEPTIQGQKMVMKIKRNIKRQYQDPRKQKNENVLTS